MKKNKKNLFLWATAITIVTHIDAKVITAQPISTTAPSHTQPESQEYPNSIQHKGDDSKTELNNEKSIVLPYFTVGADQPNGFIPSQIHHQVFMLFSPSCPHCLDFITTQLPILQKHIAKNNVEINIGFNPLNPLDVAATKMIIGTFSNGNKKIYNEKGQPMAPLDMLKILMEKRPLWLDNTIEILKTGKRDQPQKAINDYVQTISNQEEKNNWLAILDPSDELTYLKIFCGQELGLDPNYIQDCIENQELSKIVTLFPSVVAKGECNHAPFFSIDGRAVPSDTPFTSELLSKNIQDLSQKIQILTPQEITQQLKQKMNIHQPILNEKHNNQGIS